MKKIKEIISSAQEKIIVKVSNNLNKKEKNKIKNMSNKAFNITFLLVEGIGLGWLCLKYFPKKYGWEYSQTLLLISIVFTLSYIAFRKKKGKSL
jgi:hypothetical protein